MYFTGIADEAARDINGQIRATRELRWTSIEARSISGVNIHDLSDSEFDIVYGKLQNAGININCFGSNIANWGKCIDEPFESSILEANRAIPRMLRLGTKLIRIMSFAVLEDREPEDQMEDDRFRRLRQLQRMFADEGITVVHENCMCYGGMGWPYTLRLIESVPGLKLVFDTGNPVSTPDRSKPRPWPMQSSWEFYSRVREHVSYVHIKDAIYDGNEEFTFPGEGSADVRRILRDMLSRGYDGGISIEPHMVVQYHEATSPSEDGDSYANYVEYGRRLMRIVGDIQSSLSLDGLTKMDSSLREVN